MKARAAAAMAVLSALDLAERREVLAELEARDRLLQIAGVDVERAPSSDELLERARSWWADLERLSCAHPEAAGALVRAQMANVIAAGPAPRPLDDCVDELALGRTRRAAEGA